MMQAKFRFQYSTKIWNSLKRNNRVLLYRWDVWAALLFTTVLSGILAIFASDKLIEVLDVFLPLSISVEVGIVAISVIVVTIAMVFPFDTIVAFRTEEEEQPSENRIRKVMNYDLTQSDVKLCTYRLVLFIIRWVIVVGILGVLISSLSFILLVARVLPIPIVAFSVSFFFFTYSLFSVADMGQIVARHGLEIVSTCMNSKV